MSEATGMLSDLRNDRDVVELEDGRTLRLRIDADQDSQISDYECYGKVEWGAEDPDTGRERRPKGFTGNSQKIQIRNSGRTSAWWEPPTGDYASSAKRGTPEWAKEVESITNLVEFGFKSVTLELVQGHDAYNRWIVRKVQSLGGIDSLEDGYLLDVVTELAAELGS